MSLVCFRNKNKITIKEDTSGCSEVKGVYRNQFFRALSTSIRNLDFILVPWEPNREFLSKQHDLTSFFEVLLFYSTRKEEFKMYPLNC